MDRSGPQDVLRHLIACDADFRPVLSARVDLAAYAAKLAQNAARMEAWVGDELVGLVAIYCNAPDRGVAFVSSVSVTPCFAGQGIALHLMGLAIDHARALGFAQMRLEVDRQAVPALRLYAKLGFLPDAGSDADVQRMARTLS